MKHIVIVLLFFAAFLAHGQEGGEASAQQPPTQTQTQTQNAIATADEQAALQNANTNPDTDLALDYLRVLYGDSVNVFLGGDMPQRQQFDTVLGALSEAWNIIMVGLITSFVALFVAIWFLQKGHESGRSARDLFANTSTAARMLLAIFLVVPMAAGFSLAQLGPLWFIGKGNNAANYMAEVGSGFINNSGSIVPFQSSMRFHTLGMAVLESEVCTAALNNSVVLESTDPLPILPVDTGGLYALDASYNGVFGKGREGITFSLSTIKRLTMKRYSDGACGKFNNMPNLSGDKIPLAVKHKYAANIKTAFRALQLEARKTARAIYYNHNRDYANKAYATTRPYFEAIIAFEQAVDTAYQTYQQGLIEWRQNRPASQDQADEQRIKNAGWVGLGTMYLEYLLRTQETVNFLKTVDIEHTPPNYAQFSDNKTASLLFDEIKFYLDDLGGVSGGIFDLDVSRHTHTIRALLQNAGKYSNPLAASDPGKINVPTNFDDEIDSWAAQWALGFSRLEGTDPINAMIGVGRRLEDFVVGGTILKVTANTTILTLTSNGALQALSSFAIATLKQAVDVLDTLIGIALALMFFCYYYIPMVPIVHWVGGVLGWLIATIEVVLIAPVHALAHCFPDDGRFVSSRVKDGYLIMLSTFLRAPLMVMGYFAFLLVLYIGGNLALTIYTFFIDSLADRTLLGLFNFFGMTAILIYLMVMVVERSAGLITEIPDKALRFLGHGSNTLMDTKAMASGGQGYALVMGKMSTVGGGGAPKPSNKSVAPKNKPAVD